MDPTDRVRYWLDLADYDLDTAQAMLETRRYLYVGFMCHQTIEKALKGYHASNSEDEAPYTHSLRRLAELSGLRDALSEQQMTLVFRLEPLNISARYPADREKLLADLTQAKCAAFVAETKEFLLWIKQKL